jgi:aromatic ring-cleaving dioxygenase
MNDGIAKPRLKGKELDKALFKVKAQSLINTFLRCIRVAAIFSPLVAYSANLLILDNMYPDSDSFSFELPMPILPFFLTLVFAIAIFILLFKKSGKLLKKRHENISAKLKALVGINVIAEFMEQFFEDGEYDHDRRINNEIAEYSELVANWNRISGGNYVTGKYRWRTVEYSDVALYDSHVYYDSDEHKKVMSLSAKFKGQWLVCDLGKELDGTVFLSERGKLYIDISNAQTENQAFNQRFQIIASDTYTASCVLTPLLTDRILKAADTVGIGMNISFKGEYMQIALASGRDMFGSAPERASLPALRKRMEREGKRIAALLSILDGLA